MFLRGNRTGITARCAKHKLDYSKLEERKMLTGNVRVAFSDGAVFLRGDAENNQVEIIGDFTPTEITIRGVEGTTINGRPEIVVSGLDARLSNGIRAHLGQGDDFIRIEQVDVGGISRVFGGRGDDSIGFFNAEFDDLTVQTFTGDDSISLDRVLTSGALRIATLAGNDRIGISGLTAEGATLIATHDGEDRVSIKNSRSFFGDFTILTGDGDDFVGTQSVSFNQGLIFTGSEDDQVSIFDSRLAGVVSGQTGEDEFAIGGREQTPELFTAFAFEGELLIPNGRTTSVFNEQIRDGLRLGTITELLALDSRLSTVSGALIATGFDSLLNDAGSNPEMSTLFAPTDAAFAALPDGLLDSLSFEELRDILRFHISGTVFNQSDIEARDDIFTLLGESIEVEITDGGVILDGDAMFVTTNIRAKTGVLHVIDGVLLPE